MSRVGRTVCKPMLPFLVWQFLLVPLEANADTIILVCDIITNMRVVDAQNKSIGGDWKENASRIEMIDDEYIVTSVKHGNLVDRGSLTSSSQYFFLKSNGPVSLVSGVLSEVMPEIYSYTYIDRTTGQYFSDTVKINNETGARSTYVSRGPCILQEAPTTKF